MHSQHRFSVSRHSLMICSLIKVTSAIRWIRERLCWAQYPRYGGIDCTLQAWSDSRPIKITMHSCNQNRMEDCSPWCALCRAADVLSGVQFAGLTRPEIGLSKNTNVPGQDPDSHERLYRMRARLWERKVSSEHLKRCVDYAESASL